MYRFQEKLMFCRAPVFDFRAPHASCLSPSSADYTATLTAKSIYKHTRTSSCYAFLPQCFSASSSFLLFEMAPPNAPSSPPVDLRARYNVPANWQEPVMYFDPERLPALPPIPDPALAQQAFQHRTSPHLKFRDGNRTTPYDRDLNSYEPLEGIGDRLLNYAVYRCLRQRFTGATAGILGVSSYPVTLPRVPRLTRLNMSTSRTSHSALRRIERSPTCRLPIACSTGSSTPDGTT